MAQRSSRKSLTRRRTSTNGPAPATPRRTDTGAWWDDIDADVLAALADGAKSPKQLAHTLGMSEDAVTSVVSMLAQQGRLRIGLIEAV